MSETGRIVIKKKSAIVSDEQPKQYRKATDYERKKDIREHALYAPDTYIGNIEQRERNEIVYDTETDSIINKTISISNGFERLFVEVYTNASDNVGESRRARVDPGSIEVQMDRKVLSLRNEGIPIPVEMDPKENMYTPYMIFGTFWSSSNYKEERNEAGRNGYGAKLVNLFSKWFSIEIGDNYNRLKYTQKWHNNMESFDEPIIEKYNGKPYVKITYELDFERFGYTEYPDEAFALFERHCIDISLNASIPVYFNGKKIFFEDIRDYARMIYGERALENSFIHYEWPAGTETFSKKNGVIVAKDKFVVPTARMCVLDTPYDSYNVSFVNGMMTREGGDHLTAAIRSATALVIKKANERSEPKTKTSTKGAQKDEKPKKPRALITLADVKQHISVVLCFRVVNPGWESQTKTLYSHPKKQPPIVFNIPEKKLEQTLKWEIMDTLLNTVERKQDKKLTNTDGRKLKEIGPFPGRDANYAGTNKSHTCSLLVIEGKSASNYVECMISELKSRNVMGYFQLRGKMLNVMKASRDQIAENPEIKNLKRVIGLKDGVDYSNEKDFMRLRYGEVIFITDQDVDGEHIKALGINYFHCRFPELLARGFFSWLATPLVRVQKGKEKVIFYTLNEFDEWKQSMTGNWSIKYCKGLGTSTREDVKYDMSNNPIYVSAEYDEDAPGYIELAFHPKLAGDRKKWIKSYSKENDDIIRPEMKISSFINYDLVKYSIYNVRRSIPAWDGLKPSQRKILWASYMKWKWSPNDTKYRKIKVSEFGGFVSEKTDYHHGETSLYGAIIAMAQDFVGSNNLPYFFPDGQFGSRNEGGKDHASPRYIFTYPQWWLPYVYRHEDFAIMEHEKDDQNKEIEPVVFLPIIPMALVNGAEGIGTGWSTFIPSCNPLDVIRWYINRIRNADNTQMVPWYRGYEGQLYIIDRKHMKKSEEEGIIEVNGIRGDISNTDDVEGEAVDDLFLEHQEGGQQNEEDIKEKLRKAREKIISDRSKQPSSVPAYRMVTIGSYEEYDKYVLVKELPLGMWNKKYDDWLSELAVTKEEWIDTDIKVKEDDAEEKKKKKPIMIKKLDSHDVIDIKDDKQHFKLYGFRNPNQTTLRLKRGFGLTNMFLLTTEGKPIKYNTLEEVLEDFYNRRLPYYSLRKESMLKSISSQINKTDQKVAFILAVVEKRLKIRNVSKEVIFSRMDELGLNKEIYKETKLSSINKESVEKLLRQKEELIVEERKLKSTPSKQLWLSDLSELERQYVSHFPEEGGEGYDIDQDEQYTEEMFSE
jgi:DNA topoisomerase-2